MDTTPSYLVQMRLQGYLLPAKWLKRTVGVGHVWAGLLKRLKQLETEAELQTQS